MATMQFDKIDLYISDLKKLAGGTEKVIGKAVYAGADVITDQIRANIEALPAAPDIEGLYAHKNHTMTPLTVSGKQGLLDGLGIATMKNEGGVYNVKVGFEGYNRIKSRRYPKGQPIPLIARVTENGSPYTKRMPFVKPAVSAKRAAAEQAMAAAVDEEIEKIMK